MVGCDGCSCDVYVRVAGPYLFRSSVAVVGLGLAPLFSLCILVELESSRRRLRASYIIHHIYVSDCE